nr:MAG TPA: hypothetical protein [Caudoviricetes sp.]
MPPRYTGAAASRAGFVYGRGGARSGGFAAGTLRGGCPAGVPTGTQCAPRMSLPGKLRITGYQPPNRFMPGRPYKTGAQRQSPQRKRGIVHTLSIAPDGQ